LIRSRAFYLNETGDPRFDAVTMEHNSILASRDCKADVFNALTAWFARQGGQADELHFAGSLLQWPHDAVECNGLSRTEIVVPSYSVDLSQLEDSAGELYQVLSANARQQLRRAIRRFEEFGPPCIREAATEIEALEFFTEMKALHSESWQRRGKSHAFTSPFFEAFHRLLINRTFADGGTQMLRASAGGRVLGYLYNFRLGQRVYAYQSGFADGNQRERPGMVTHALAIQHAFHSGARVYDFMAGRNRLT
jgi:CelD/BcsL family acetyltransferase involved in cellulose biosynthesis